MMVADSLKLAAATALLSALSAAQAHPAAQQLPTKAASAPAPRAATLKELSAAGHKFDPDLEKAASAPAARQPAKLSTVDAWRYRRCQENAAQAPTAEGVKHGMRLCRDQFDQ